MVVSETAPVAENLFDMSLEEILSDVEWEPTVEEILTPKISLVTRACRSCPGRGAGEGENSCNHQIQMSEILCSWTSKEEANPEA